MCMPDRLTFRVLCKDMGGGLVKEAQQARTEI